MLGYPSSVEPRPCRMFLKQCPNDSRAMGGNEDAPLWTAVSRTRWPPCWSPDSTQVVRPPNESADRARTLHPMVCGRSHRRAPSRCERQRKSLLCLPAKGTQSDADIGCARHCVPAAPRAARDLPARLAPRLSTPCVEPPSSQSDVVPLCACVTRDSCPVRTEISRQP